MNCNSLWLSIVVGFSLLVGSHLHAQNPRVIEDSNSTETLTISGEKITIAGSNNTFLILGTVSTLVIAGSDNTIRVQSVDQIVMAGSKNNVTWSAAVSLDIPKVEDSGKKNTVAQGEVSPDDQ